jgi:hypothetical protein
MPLTTTQAVKQLSDQNTQGTQLGVGATDKIGFFGATPIVQPSGGSQALDTRGNAGGSVSTASTTQSPSAVSTSTTAEFAMTVVTPTTATWQIATGDFVFVNKPIAQAGLGMGNVRVSGANSIAVAFSNFTSATITPTASQSYAVVALRGLGSFTATLSPTAVAANSTLEQIFPVTGIRAGDLVGVAKPSLQAGLDIVGMRAVASNSLGITFCNVGGTSITPTAAEGYSVISLNGIDAVGNTIIAEASVGVIVSQGATASNTASETAVTLTGLATTDTVMGVSKPTAQVGLGIVGYRASAANILGITFGTWGISVTPTANEVYGVSLFRPAPTAPLLLYSTALTPTVVASNTTAEQTFTVTGLLSGTPVWVNKPTWQSGLGIVGVRVSASNTLAINFCNATNTGITPTAETYVIGNFQMAIPDRSDAWVQPASLASQGAATLGNAMRSALVSLGLIAGA